MTLPQFHYIDISKIDLEEDEESEEEMEEEDYSSSYSMKDFDSDDY